MKKGEQTRTAIIEVARTMAARDGLEGLTIGHLAEQMNMSKSGVFAHFGSREELQIAVLKAHERDFVESVLVPSLTRQRGLDRLRAMFGNWLERTAIEAAKGCIWISGATEYDDRPGAVRDVLVSMVQNWQSELSRAISQAIESGELIATLNMHDLVFELHGVVLALHHDARLLKSPGSVERATRSFERIIESYRQPAAVAAVAAKRTPV